MIKKIKSPFYILATIFVIAHGIHGAEPQEKFAKKTELISGDFFVRSHTLNAAGVLPVIYDQDKITVLLGRQTDKINRGKYDYFAGIADAEDNGDSTLTAAREWHEEARLGSILKWTVEQTQTFIKENVKGYIILATHWPDKNTYGVMYFVQVSKEIKEKLFAKFESSYRDIQIFGEQGEQNVGALLEKDKLVEVEWNDLFKWVTPGHGGLKSLVSTAISGQESVENIALRPILSVLLKGKSKSNQYVPENETLNLPLGIFIFATQQIEKPQGEKEFRPSQLISKEKEDLNEIVSNHLMQKKEKNIQKAAILQVVGTPEQPESPEKKPDTPQPPQLTSSVIIPPVPTLAEPQATPTIGKTGNLQGNKPAAAIKSEPKKQSTKQQLSFNILTLFGNALSSALDGLASFFKGAFDFMRAMWGAR